MQRRQRLRLTTQGKVVFGLAALALLAFLLSAIFPGKTDEPPTAPPASEIEFIISKNSGSSGDVSVWVAGDIVTMPLEEYLVGVVAAEMPASFEPEALKAQAVAARTYTTYKANHGGCSAHGGADICTDSRHCQAYLTAEEMASNWGSDTQMYLDKIISAVKETQGEMVYYQGEQIQVFYHASSGGYTENSENVYAQALPYLVSVESEGEENSSNFYGKVTLSKEDFKKRMEKQSPSIKFKGSELIGDIQRYESGRVSSVRIGNETFSGREVRSIFDLNSANFTVEVSDNVTFSTVGFGHGVGLSQTGANAMAKDGSNYIDILTHYYTGVTIE